MLKQRVVAAIEVALEKISAEAARDVIKEAGIRIEYARDEKFGDYACLIAMDKKVRSAFAEHNDDFKNPQNFAIAIVEALRQLEEPHSIFDKIEIAGPGFINLTIRPAILFEYVGLALKEESHYGISQTKTPKKIIFEFVSANPTGPLNIVSARAAALGDSCCNLLEAIGHSVHREFYVNDYGNQVNLLGQSCLLRYLESKGLDLKFFEKKSEKEGSYPEGPGILFPAGGYHGEYIIEAIKSIDPAFTANLVPEALIDQVKSESDETELDLFAGDIADFNFISEQIGREVIEHFLKKQEADLSNFRVKFSKWFRESTLHADDSVLKAKDALSKYIYQEDGKVFFQSSRFTDDQDRVVVRDDGRPTYLLADIAYHNTKIERDFELVYNIWGPDHHGYIARLAGAMQGLGFPAESFQVLIAQQVTLMENGKQLRMSKRSGRLITMEDLLNDVPVDVARYFFVMRTFESHLEFDLDEAKDTSDKNPYYYVAYAHARIQSIIRKAHELSKTVPTDEKIGTMELSSFEVSPERRRLLRLIAQMAEEVSDAAEALEPHRLINYLYNLASALSKFYAPKTNRVIEQDHQTAQLLLAILAAVALCLKNGLRILGMAAPDRLSRDQ